MVDSNTNNAQKSHIEDRLKRWGRRVGLIVVTIGFFASLYTLQPLLHTLAKSPVAQCLAPMPSSHEVTEGENLACISERYYSKARYASYICVYNQMRGRLGVHCLIEVGEVIFIPTGNELDGLPAMQNPPARRNVDYRCDDDSPPWGDMYARN